jgi:hypothetical protein
VVVLAHQDCSLFRLLRCGFRLKMDHLGALALRWVEGFHALQLRLSTSADFIEILHSFSGIALLNSSLNKEKLPYEMEYLVSALIQTYLLFEVLEYA